MVGPFGPVRNIWSGVFRMFQGSALRWMNRLRPSARTISGDHAFLTILPLDRLEVNRYDLEVN